MFSPRTFEKVAKVTQTVFTLSVRQAVQRNSFISNNIQGFALKVLAELLSLS
jgi:hypothetical protein